MSAKKARPAHADAVESMHAEGKNDRQIGAALRVTAARVRQIRLKIGLGTVPRRDDQTQAMVAAYGAGEDPDDIATRFGVSRAAVIRAALYRGIKAPKEAVSARASAQQKGRPGRPVSLEAREKIAAAKRGKPRPRHVIEAMQAGRRAARERAKAQTP